MRLVRSRWRQIVSVLCLLIASATFTGIGILLLTLRSLEVDDPSSSLTQQLPVSIATTQHQISHTDTTDTTDTNQNVEVDDDEDDDRNLHRHNQTNKGCATVEEMGDVFRGGFLEESLRIRKLIQQHFEINGASRVRDLPPEQFCRQGFVIAKASEAGFGNEMYKILTAAALSIMLNRSLIIGQTRGKYPFGDYISYTNMSFTLNEVKHLWRQNLCLTTYGKHLVMRIDDFQKPARTNVLCSNWREWEEPIIWFQNTTDAVAAQFFLKNVHTEMRKAASELFGQPKSHYRPNVFGELMRVLVSPSEIVKKAVNSVLSRGMDPDITLHMRMLMNKSVRTLQAALNCTRKVVQDLSLDSRPKLVLVSDTPSFVEDLKYYIDDFAEVLHFDFESFEGGLSGGVNGSQNLNFRARDWGPAPRWVAFVDFFLASRAKYAVISGAHRRVGTTYAQLIAALAAANSIGTSSSSSSSSDSVGFLFFSSFQSSLVSEGLKNQVGWGHVWNRFAGPLSCQNQTNQCANTPLLPPAWWDGLWQSPIPRDVRRMEAYGIRLSALGTFDENDLPSFCNSRKKAADATITLI